MIKAPIDLQDLRRRLSVKAKTFQCVAAPRESQHDFAAHIANYRGKGNMVPGLFSRTIDWKSKPGTVVSRIVSMASRAA